MFSWDALDAAETALDRMRVNFVALGEVAAQPDADFVRRFMAMLNDDLNFPQALALAYELLKSDLAPGLKKATLLNYDEAFGLGLGTWVAKPVDAPDHVRMVANLRWTARNAKDWAEADRLRGELAALGWTMKDGKDSYTLAKD